MTKANTKQCKYVQRTFFITLSDGTKERIRAYGKTAKEAEKKLLEKRIQYAQGILTLNSNTLFKNWTRQWMDTYKKPKLTAKSYKDIQSRINNVFLPTLGNMPISDIKSTHIQNALNELQGKSNSYMRKCKNDIKNLFDKAILNDMIVKNPAISLELPQGPNGTARALTEHEKAIFMQTIPKHHRGILFAVSLACGLRPGEVRALTWFNVDMNKHTIEVNQAVESGSKNIKPPKSAAGVRTIPMPLWLVELLRTVPRNQNTPYVFYNQNNQPLTQTGYMRAWHSFLRLMDIEAGAKLYRNKIIVHAIAQDIIPYYLRHTYATELAENNIPLKTAQYLMGHSDISVTAKYYTHITDKMIEDARQKINSIR